MSTTTPQNCPQCGTPLPANARAGLCPRCVMEMNLATQTEFTGEVGPHGTKVIKQAPTPAELADKFPQLEILELLGRGGMGAVYKARQKELDRIVALKILPPGIGETPGFAERFTREAKALAKLHHPNIVTLFEFGRADGLFFFLMEYVDGVNLRQLLNSGRVASREALAIVPQICDALQFAHDHGIVHRDIKPENILMDRRGRVKVADFGLAKIVGEAGGTGSPLPAAGLQTEDGAHGVTRPTSELTEAGKVMGTPQYMAPEQKDKPLEVDHRADIYALGVVFYQMLTGKLPGKPIEPPSSRSRGVQIDVRLDEIVLRALEMKPELRYQQASVMKTQVETLVENPGVKKSTTESRVARIVEIFAAIGFLGSLGFLIYALLPATRPFFEFPALFGFFWMIGFAIAFGWAARRRAGKQPPGSSRRDGNAGEPPSGNSRDERRRRTLLWYGLVISLIGLPIGIALKLPLVWALSLAGIVIGGFKLRRSGQPQETGGPAKSRIRRVLQSMVVALVIVFALRTFVIAPFYAVNDAVSPEVPRGSWVLVLKLGRSFEAGDVVVYKSGQKSMLGRVAGEIYDGDLPTRPGDAVPKRIYDRVLIERWGDDPKEIPASDVVGKVIFNTRFSTLSKAPESGKIRMVNTAPFTANFDGGTVELVGLAPHPATNHVWWEPGGAALSEKFRSGLGNWKNSDRMFEVRLDVHGELDIARVEEVQFPWNPRVQTGGGVLEIRAGEDNLNSSFFTFGTPKDVANVDMKVAVFDGKWEAVIKDLRPSNAQVVTQGNETTRSGYAQTGKGDAKWAAGVECVEKSGGEVLVTYRYTRHEGWATEMVMVRDDGKVIPLSGESKYIDGIEQGTTSISNHDFARLKEFQLRRNQYQWVEFRHVTLVPGKMTGIGVVDASATAANTGADAATQKAFREVFGHMMGETKAVSPTPEIEATLESVDRRGSKIRFLDFEKNGVIEVPREFDLGREGGGWTRNQKENWLKEKGIDLMVMGNGLQPWRLLTPVDNELKLVRIPPETWRDEKKFDWSNLKAERGDATQFIGEDMELIEHQIKGRATHPDHTFLFTTSDGTRGLLRFTGHLLAGGGDQIGLKLLFRKLPKGEISRPMSSRPVMEAVPAVGSSSTVTSGRFDDVFERTLSDPDNLDGKSNRETLDLKIGELLNALGDAPKEQGGRLRALIASEGDLYAEYDDYVSKQWAFVTAGLKLSDFLTRQWDSATSTDVNEALKEPTTLQRKEHSGATLYLLPDGLLPMTFAFETRNGERGLLQVTALNDNPRAVTLRYKLVSSSIKSAAEQNPSAENDYRRVIEIESVVLEVSHDTFNSFRPSWYDREKLAGDEKIKMVRGPLVTTSGGQEVAIHLFDSTPMDRARGEDQKFVQQTITILPTLDEDAIRYSIKGHFTRVWTNEFDNAWPSPEKPTEDKRRVAWGAPVIYGLPGAAKDRAKILVLTLRPIVEAVPRKNAKRAAASSVPVVFDPVVERVLDGVSNALLNIESGKIIPMPKVSAASAEKTWRQLIGEADFGVYPGPEGKLAILSFMEMDELRGDVWDNVSEATVSESKPLPRMFPYSTTPENQPPLLHKVFAKDEALPMTFSFRTRNNVAGILQVVAFTEQSHPPHEMRIRYKLLQQTNAPAAATTTRTLSALIAGENWGEMMKLFPQAIRLTDKANAVEGAIQTNLPILLEWDMSLPMAATTGMEKRPSPELKPGSWLEFPSNGQNAIAHLRYDGWPHAAWEFHLEIFDAGGRPIKECKATLENSGKRPPKRQSGIEQSAVRFDVGPEALSQGKRFRLSVESLWAEQEGEFRFGTELPLYFGLSGVEYSGMFRAEWLKFDSTNTQAIIHAKVLQWPKCRWKVHLELFDGDGRPAGDGKTVIENAGFITSDPARAEEDIRFRVANRDSGTQVPRRFRLRVERIPVLPKSGEDKIKLQSSMIHKEAWDVFQSVIERNLGALHGALVSNNPANALRAQEKLLVANADYAKRFGTQAELPHVFVKKIEEMGPVLRSGNVKKARELRHEAEQAFTPEYLARFARLAGHEDLAAGYESENNLPITRAQRVAMVQEAHRAFRGLAETPQNQRINDDIPEKFWGETIQSLKPVRVVNDRMNIKIVLRESGGIESGFYVNLPISSYAPQTHEFLEFVPLSQPDDKTFGELYRYKLDTKPKTTVFSPVSEKTLQSPSTERTNAFIDLDTGTVLLPPATLDVKEPWKADVYSNIWNWAAANGVDAVADTSQEVRGLRGFGLGLAPVPDSEWEEATADSIGMAVNQIEAHNASLDIKLPRPNEDGRRQYVASANVLSTQSNPSRTFAFRTREKKLGILQLVQISDEPRGFVKFRYKLVQAIK